MLPPLLALGAIVGWSREWKPFSQLDRLAIPMAVVAAFPAAALCGRLFGGGEPAAAGRGRRWAWAAAQGIVLATVLFGFRVVYLHYANRGSEPLRTLPPEIREFADWIRAAVPEEGRLGFAGRTVHFFGGGSIRVTPIGGAPIGYRPVPPGTPKWGSEWKKATVDIREWVQGRPGRR